MFEKTEQFDAGGCEMRDFFFHFTSINETNISQQQFLSKLYCDERFFFSI